MIYLLKMVILQFANRGMTSETCVLFSIDMDEGKRPSVKCFLAKSLNGIYHLEYV
jgi:hypothetical protein